MNRRNFLTFTAGAAALTGQSVAQPAAKDDGWPTRETLNKLFRQYAEYFRTHLSDRYKALPLELGGDDWIIRDDAESSRDSAGEPSLWLRSPLEDLSVYMLLQVGKTGQVICADAGIHEFPPRFRGPGKPPPPPPKWSLPEAITRAEGVLKDLGWEVAADMLLDDVSGWERGGEWYALWHRTFDGLPEIPSNAEPDKISVSFNEAGEGARFTRWRRGPVPQRTTPKLASGEAMAIAIKALPTFLDESLWTGHVMSLNLKEPALRKYKGTDLCVTSPNWAMDSERFKVSIGYPPRERRLCWRSTFQFQEKTGGALNDDGEEPDRSWILLEVHVDALTGELLGGQLTSRHKAA